MPGARHWAKHPHALSLQRMWALLCFFLPCWHSLGCPKPLQLFCSFSVDIRVPSVGNVLRGSPPLGGIPYTAQALAQCHILSLPLLVLCHSNGPFLEQTWPESKWSEIEHGAEEPGSRSFGLIKSESCSYYLLSISFFLLENCPADIPRGLVQTVHQTTTPCLSSSSSIWHLIPSPLAFLLGGGA